MVKKFFTSLGVTNRKEFWGLVIQFIKFGLVGLSNTAVSLGCYYIILFLNENWYMAGGIIGTVVSIANAFFWNDRFVFTGNRGTFKDKLKRILKTYISYGGTSLLSIALLWIEVNFFSISKSVAPIINLLITIPLNFLVNKLWTFRGPKRNT